MTEITWNRAGGLSEPDLLGRLLSQRSSAEYKLRILCEADECSTPGEIGALLRRERLYMSHLTYWRAQHEAGALTRFARTYRIRPGDRRDAEIADLQRRLECVEAELEKRSR
jgi:hypothetical protein